MLTGGFARVSSSMMTNTFIRDIQRNMTTITKLQHQISTGKRIEYASDDPVGSARVLDYRQKIQQTDQYLSNISDADSLASNVDSSLSEMEDLIYRIRDLAVRGSSESTMTQTDRDAIANEMDALIDALVDQANQKFNGEYLFSGLATNVTPFTAKTGVDFVYTGAAVAANGSVSLSMPSYTMGGDTRISQAITGPDSVVAVMINGQNLVSDLGGSYTVDPVTNTVQITDAGSIGLNPTDKVEIRFNKTVAVEYNGNMGTKEIEIGENSRVGVTFAGAAAAESSSTSVFGKYSGDGTQTGTVEMFQKLMDLRDAIYKYDEFDITDNTKMEWIQQGLDDIDALRGNITNIRAEVGARVNRLELATNRLNNIRIYTDELRSNIEEVDMEEAISQFSLAQSVYQSALAAGARIIQTTLLDFLS